MSGGSTTWSSTLTMIMSSMCIAVPLAASSAPQCTPAAPLPQTALAFAAGRYVAAMLRAFVLSLVACVFAAAGVGAAAAQPRARLELDSRCDALTGLVPATVAVVTGDMSDARKGARTPPRPRRA